MSRTYSFKAGIFWKASSLISTILFPLSLITFKLSKLVKARRCMTSIKLSSMRTSCSSFRSTKVCCTIWRIWLRFRQMLSSWPWMLTWIKGKLFLLYAYQTFSFIINALETVCFNYEYYCHLDFLSSKLCTDMHCVNPEFISLAVVYVSNYSSRIDLYPSSWKIKGWVSTCMYQSFSVSVKLLYNNNVKIPYISCDIFSEIKSFLVSNKLYFLYSFHKYLYVTYETYP